MKIISLEPYITDVLVYLGVTEKLVGVSHRCEQPSSTSVVTVVTTPAVVSQVSGLDGRVAKELCTDFVDVEQLLSLAPDLVLTESEQLAQPGGARWIQEYLETRLGKKVLIAAFSARTVDAMYGVFEEIGKLVGNVQGGRDLGHRLKAQLMDWSDSFYPRMKNKRVTVLSSVAPLRLAGKWIPDLVKCASAAPQHYVVGDGEKETSWSEIVSFRPDVIIVAPEGYSLDESVKTLKYLERAKEWEGLPAVKRGEVVFCDGLGLYRPGPKLLSGAAILISAIAGLESGYITKRDEFFRLRWVELHRHRFV